MTATRLQAVIFCQSQAKRFSGELLKDRLHLPDRLPPARVVTPEDLERSFVSPYLRAADVPLAFHRESFGYGSSLTSHQEMMSHLEAHGRMLQYLFSDGLILTGHQILYHPHSKLVARHLLPLSVNVKSDPQGRPTYAVAHPARGSTRPSWQVQAEQVILSTLTGALRIARTAIHEGEEPIEIIFCVNEDPTQEREVLKLETVEFRPDQWGPWRLNTDLPAPVSGVHYGRARLELDAEEFGDLIGLAQTFHVDLAKRRLLFHTLHEQVHRLKAHTPPPPPETPVETPAAAGSPVESSLETQNSEAQRHLLGLETGVSVHLAGHSVIQATALEVGEVLSQQGRHLAVYPESRAIEAEQIKPRLNLTGDGSFRLITRFDDRGETWEIFGLPQSCAYLLLNLQLGLGATTGYSNTQIAHGRKGLKRERDMKILRNLGFSALIFFDAANFALGHALSDGTNASNESELLKSLYERLGSLILKAEGWPTQTGSLETLCSKNVTTLIEGFISQVIRDVQGREIALYLPSGEIRLKGLSKAIVRLFHAFMADIAAATDGACFTRARTKYFADFLNGRPNPEREDLAVRVALSAEASARAIYQPIVGDRFLLPETSLPPRGAHLLNLLNQGFELSVDGKEIEEFDADEFRPEFTVREERPEGDVIPIGKGKIDWFELHPRFFFKGAEITVEQAGRLAREGMIEFQGRLYRVRDRDLPSLKRLTQFWASIQGHNAGLLRAKRRKTEDTYYHLPRSQTLELLALRASGVKVRGGERWDAICRFYDSLDKDRPPLQLPETFHAKLQPYQVTGVQWLRDIFELGLGGILADDMGLGKTVTSLAFLESLRIEERMGSCLVLVPTSLTFNWISEAARFTPEIPVSMFSSREPEATLDFVQSRPASLVICTYGLLQENSELFQQVQWNTIIFDEAQNLKNITTKRTTAARKLRSDFKLALTGTPLENHYGEFYSLFDLIVPGALGDLPSFREVYVNPERVLREDLDFLKLKTKPLLLRRTKAQVMNELPPKVETTIKLPFEDEQKRIYRDIASAYNQQIKTAIAEQGEAKTQLQMLTALLRLRQACSDPSAIPGVKYSGEPPKITTLIEALQEVTEGGASALVFTQFLATYERIRQSLAKAKIPFYDINGSDSRLAREKKLQGFQEDSRGAVMLMTLKTGGVGLNLTKASYIFHIEPWWNPAVENQATDRAHRIGQKSMVQVYRYLIRESVEEKIEILKDIKSKRFDALFADNEGEAEIGKGGSSLSQRDFEYLLS